MGELGRAADSEQKSASLTSAELRRILRYNPQTGDFFWIISRNGTRRNGLAGTPNGEGRIQIRINGRKYYAAQLAWLYMTGHWPHKLIDHKNRINNDDRWENLRLANHAENATNIIKKKWKRPDLPRGVTEHPGGYLAKISINGKRKHLGLFSNPRDAELAYLKASEFRAEFLP